MSSKRNGDSPNTKQPPADEKPICFIIMPISDPEGYKPEHFQHVFQDLFVPACEKAGLSTIAGGRRSGNKSDSFGCASKDSRFTHGSVRSKQQESKHAI